MFSCVTVVAHSLLSRSPLTPTDRRRTRRESYHYHAGRLAARRALAARCAFTTRRNHPRIRCDDSFELLARLCPNTTGAELRSVCTEAGMFAIRSRRKSISEKDMLDAVQKVIKG